jgi:hypothetical protein
MSGIMTMIGLVDGLIVGLMYDGGGVVTIGVIGDGVDPIVGGCVCVCEKINIYKKISYK